MDKLCEHPYPHKTVDINQKIRQWLWQIRTDGIVLTSPTEPAPQALIKIQQVVKLVGKPLSELEPRQLLVLCEAGSHLYNLSTPTSDTDYLAVYVAPHQVSNFSVLMEVISISITIVKILNLWLYRNCFHPLIH